MLCLLFTYLCIDFRHIYDNGNDAQQNFIQNLAIFLCTFFGNHLREVESVKEHHQALLEGHSYLVGISEVSDVEVWKICLDYWNKLVWLTIHQAFISSVPSITLTSISTQGLRCL